jgi:hypothetical protein
MRYYNTILFFVKPFTFDKNSNVCYFGLSKTLFLVLEILFAL